MWSPSPCAGSLVWSSAEESEEETCIAARGLHDAGGCCIRDGGSEQKTHSMRVQGAAAKNTDGRRYMRPRSLGTQAWRRIVTAAQHAANAHGRAEKGGRRHNAWTPTPP